MSGLTKASAVVLVVFGLSSALYVQAIPVLLNGSPSSVNLTQNGATGTTATDAFAIYAASSSNPAQNPPLKYKILTYSPPGTANVTFSVPNIRQDIIVRYLQATNTSVQPVAGFPTLVGMDMGSNRIVNANPNEPTQVHASVTAIPTNVQVTWTTGPAPPPQYIQYGFSSGSYNNTVQAMQFVTYTANSLCGQFTAVNTFIDPGLFITATISVAPRTKIYYRVGSLNTTSTTSQEFFFTTPPAYGDTSSVKVILNADMSVTGAADGSLLVNAGSDNPLNTIAGIANEVQKNGYSLVHMNGDLAYADGYLFYWDLFMNSIQPFTAYAPFMTVDGNHERDWPASGDAFGPNPGNKNPAGPNPFCVASQNPFVACDSKGECGSITAARFGLPTFNTPNPSPVLPPTSGPSRIKWYSHNYGPIHFLHFSTEEPYNPGSAQYQFIASDLASVDRTKTPWVVVNGHRPMYADSTDFTGLPDPSMNNVVAPSTANEDDGDQYVARQLRANLEALFASNNVDLYYNGHKHIYYHTCPVRFGLCASTRDSNGAIQGTVYVTGGNAGRSLANPAKQLLQLNPAYANYTTAYYNGTLGVPDPFSPANGGYYVNTTTTVYGYHQLVANATHLIFQPMDVTTIPAKPFVDPQAAFILTRIPPPVSSTPPATTSVPPPATTLPPATTTTIPATTSTPPATTLAPPPFTVAPPATCTCPTPTCPPVPVCPSGKADPLIGAINAINQAVNSVSNDPLHSGR